MVVAVYRARGRQLGDGRLLFTFVALYGVVRFFDTFLRLDAPLWGGLALAQWTALAFVAAGVIASRATRRSSSRARRS